MNLFIMWMAGSTISIFPIMMVGMMFIRPIQALMSIQQSKLVHEILLTVHGWSLPFCACRARIWCDSFCALVFAAFKSIDGAHATLQRVVYTLGNLVGLGLAVYKCQVMGLLPTHPSDWLAFVQPQEVKHYFLVLTLILIFEWTKWCLMMTEQTEVKLVMWAFAFNCAMFWYFYRE